ncbi:MAG: hypothetical protein ACLTZH_04275 [Subdoligranulum sp.]
MYPFAARTALRRRQKHRAWALRLCGTAVLCLAAGLILRDTVFRGGQPEAPVTTAESTEQPSPHPDCHYPAGRNGGCAGRRKCGQ